ncbi:Bifunctional protein: zinc-containing alcohol dehydrogenase [Labilithrix luteola]|uniref:Zinc-type alcohol dehydrogenase-like protein n=1 Tax=Labilithrix luteola TaxID=1391654 RepID=A0A0K1QDC0_9BACT|nr:zinc-binding alcohol dehydrogenase family protein [Labilithrix luteola]AKV03708.1 Bifunctional protein: zinc-containing alcohol dehydrogenase [Labilithrix luteola]
MKAIISPEPLAISSSRALVDVELPVPVPGPRDVLVEVRAVSVNPADAKVRKRTRPPGSSPVVLGWDAAGVVVRVGNDASRFSVGDEVYFAGDLTRPGANSQFCLVDERIVGPKPKSLDFAEAAAMPLTGLTVYEALFERMHVGRGDASLGKSLLVVGGAGGVGSMAIQVAKTATRATVLATASREESKEWCRKLGADHVLDHRCELPSQLSDLGLSSVDFILCTADTDPYFDLLTTLVAPQGVIAFIVPSTKPVDMAPLHTKSASVVWELMFTRPRFQTSDMAEQGRILEELGRSIDAGHIRTTMRDRRGPISARTLREAHAQIESGTTIGKIVLEGWS